MGLIKTINESTGKADMQLTDDLVQSLAGTIVKEMGQGACVFKMYQSLSSSCAKIIAEVKRHSKHIRSVKLKVTAQVGSPTLQQRRDGFTDKMFNRTHLLYVCYDSRVCDKDTAIQILTQADEKYHLPYGVFTIRGVSARSHKSTIPKGENRG